MKAGIMPMTGGQCSRQLDRNQKIYGLDRRVYNGIFNGLFNTVAVGQTLSHTNWLPLISKAHKYQLWAVGIFKNEACEQFPKKISTKAKCV